MFQQTTRRMTRTAALALALAGLAAPAADAATPVEIQPFGQAHASVIGGYQPGPRIWPWMTALTFSPRVHQGNDFDRQFCGATLVGPRVVLTAAHCVTESDGSLTHADTVQAVLGKDVLSAAGGEHLDVASIVRHPQWNRATLEHDLALVYLVAPSAATPAELIGSGSSVPIGTTLTAMGWGRTTIGDGEQVYSDSLKAVDLPLWSDDDCAAADATWAGAGSYHPDTMLCAGYTEYIDATCKGDSGGPLMLKDSAGVWRLLGVVSWGKPDCDRMGRPSNFAWLGNEDMLAFVRQGIQNVPAPAPAPTPQRPAPAPAPTVPAPTAPVQPRVVTAPPATQSSTDDTAPAVGRILVNPLRVRAGRSFTVSFTASEAARVDVRLRGPQGRGGSGTSYAQSGAQVLRLHARLGSMAMRAGAWRVSLRATDAAGHRSATRTARFVVVR